MALGLAQVSAGLYNGLAIWLLVSGLSPRSIIPSTTLFTFLMCRLLVAWNPSKRSQAVTIAQVIASADSGSRRGALVLFPLCCTWLYELLIQGALLFFMTIFGGIMATAIYNDAFRDVHEAADTDGSTTAVSVEVDQFKEMAGFDPTEMFKMIPWRLLVYLVGLAWLNFLSLGVYLLGHAVVSLNNLLTSPTSMQKESDSDKAASK
ncbi:hypothetical protein CNMCM5793_000226 [Aspergillus hiratsukae]|uniref:Uncharacterized protein n=1 Tax=Aspergillus hiratsukae TaxID=1194566 RepID=A0A8H6QIM9_9EURO|nr:hypothetical protein CNMCM5793_000226 [Aspergillus hiratsukae]KAF7172907.1 hypothetical protein CNMCM6106_007073 [Aspergillus hiratsukae]